MSNNITLAQVAAMADDAWINSPVQCVFRITKQGTAKTSGKPYWQAELTDPNDPSCPVVSTMLMNDPTRYDGKMVSIEGKGSKKGSFKDKPQLNIGRQAFLKIVGDAGGAAIAPAQNQPAGRVATPSAPQAPRPAFSADGAKIGGCVARAGEYITASNVELTEDEVVRVAGIFLRATTRLEQGEWAQQANQSVRRPQPGPGGQAFPPPQENIDEDVPFN
jgi:hypothetical protein